MAKAKAKKPKTTDQLQRFRDMAREVGADESPDALDRAIGRLNLKATGKPKRP